MKTFVYCIRNDARQSVKIGRSNNPEVRLSQLQTGSSDALRLVCAFQGNEKTESVVHDIFREYRMSGEWFADNIIFSLGGLALMSMAGAVIAILTGWA